MGWAIWALAGGLLAMTLLAVALAVRLRVEHRRSNRDLERLQAETTELRTRVTTLAEQVHTQELARVDPDGPDYVITRLGDTDLAARDGTGTHARRVPDQVVLSAAFGEPLVKTLAFGHGVRRALSAESRNRIGFVVRRETRRSRKVRRREMRRVWREMRTQGEGSRAESTRAEGTEDVA